MVDDFAYGSESRMLLIVELEWKGLDDFLLHVRIRFAADFLIDNSEPAGFFKSLHRGMCARAELRDHHFLIRSGLKRDQDGLLSGRFFTNC